MSDEEVARRAVFHPPVVRPDVPEAVRVERPPHVDVEVVAPPAPELRAALDDPKLAAEVWQADAPADDGDAATQLALAFYLLQSLHVPSKPGYEHLVRDDDGE